MIAWWGWVILWSVLLSALVIMLALFAYWLFRKLVVLTDAVAAIADRSSFLNIADVELVRPHLAVLATAEQVRDRESARTAHRAARRTGSSSERLERARRITAAEASQMKLPADWYSR